MTELVKHFQNNMQGIPQLTNNWGSLITLLDATLVTGFNHRPILSISKSEPNAITANIQVGSGHGFIDRQVIRISGSTNGWDGDYKILAANASELIIECDALKPTSISGSATCFTAPLGFEIIFSTPADSTTPKRAYRSTNPDSLGLILLVHDFCSPGASSTGAKFAKVGVVSSMSDIDTINGVQMPFDSAKPNANWGWDGTYHGWAKWYYKLPNYSVESHYAPDSQAPNNTFASFYIAGNSTSFLIDCLCSNFNSYSVYGFVEFEDQYLNAKNTALLASGINLIRAQDSGYFYNSRGAYLKTIGTNAYATTNLNAIAWYDTNGQANFSKLTGNLDISSSSTDKNVLIDAMIFDSNNIPRCVLPFIKNHLSTSNETIFLQKVGKVIKRYSSYNGTIFQYALTLEVE